ncbi:LOW QUALITY PROTEIN: reverse transcriptase [Phytophthora megakarya]|uniref:Reverse transcriptase n=1 Tax=Phytophthora megakarya TaxID=4795 RepID=A0A225UAQ2_9STRA|nr:LOW QUALITY PROTEIN: reverse transcriptase [Phytophthora megakarya]
MDSNAIWTHAPRIYQSVINNCLWGFVRLPPEEEAEVDQDVLDFLESRIRKELSKRQAEGTYRLNDSFQRNIPMPSHIGPVLGRSSYIDDITHGAKTWNQLCENLDTLLYRLRYWNISVIGKRSIPYLSDEISAEGIRATPKIAKGVRDLPFPQIPQSLNYYHKFIEDFPWQQFFMNFQKTRYVRDETSHELMNHSNCLKEQLLQRQC